jgi:alpha-L-fucosidase 2
VEALPVGNGRLGAMVFGGVGQERLQLNEDSVWSGSPQEADNPAGREALPRIRELLLAGKYREAQELTYQKMVCLGDGSGHGSSANLPFGSYQTLGDLTVTLAGAAASAETAPDYRRQLDLDTAIATTGFRLPGGARLTREVFASHPHQVLVLRLTADRPDALSFDIAMARSERATTVPVRDDELVMSGRTPDGRGGDGLRFVARLRARVEGGGTVAPAGGGLAVRGASAVTLLLAAATDYDMKSPPTYRGGDPEARTAQQIAAAQATPYPELRAAHVADHQRLFRRAALDLGGHDRRALPTDERVAALASGALDPDLVATHFAFGRYLLIASSRPGDLAANLQGIWADGMQAPWNGDYHSNINVQMNY